MRTFLFFFVAAAIALVLQCSVCPWLPLGGSIPDLMLIICVYLGLHQHTVGGALGAFLLGYAQDSFSGSTMGLNAFAMSLVFVVVYLTSRRLWVENTISTVVLVFLASVIKTLVVILLLAVFLTTTGVWTSTAKHLLVEAVLAAALSPAIFALLAQSRRVAEQEDEG